MKTKLRFLVIAALFTLLCFPASKESNYFNFVGKVEYSLKASSTANTIEKVEQWALISSAESLIRTYPVFRSSPYSVAFKQSVQLAGYHDHLYVSAYSHYCFLFKNLPIPKWEGILIYPFHYFW